MYSSRIIHELRVYLIALRSIKFLEKDS